MSLSNNLENTILSDTHWTVQLVQMKVKAQISQEPSLEHNQDQMPSRNQGWLKPF